MRSEKRSSPGRGSGVAVALALAVAGCAGGIFDPRSDLELTWDKAVIALPARGSRAVQVGTIEEIDLAARLAVLAQVDKLPVVLYLHGCTGIGNFDFFEALAGAGYVVIAPDSMARRFRPLQCEPESRTGGFNLFVYDFRQAEIGFALDRLGAIEAIDGRNLFLVGTSEGGVATALYHGDEFRARVIAQWTCTGVPRVRGIAAPSVDADSRHRSGRRSLVRILAGTRSGRRLRRFHEGQARLTLDRSRGRRGSRCLRRSRHRARHFGVPRGKQGVRGAIALCFEILAPPGSTKRLRGKKVHSI